jgi:hypothetical protein
LLAGVYEQKVRTDGYINEILGQPSSAALEAPSAYKSAINVLNNGPTMIEEAQAELRPPPSKGDLDQMVAQWPLQRLTMVEIDSRLRTIAGTARLKRVNDKLKKVASRLNVIYEKLANCFRAADCRPGREFSRIVQCSQSHFTDYRWDKCRGASNPRPELQCIRYCSHIRPADQWILISTRSRRQTSVISVPWSVRANPT